MIHIHILILKFKNKLLFKLPKYTKYSKKAYIIYVYYHNA